MPELSIFRADFDDPEHAVAIVDIVAAYAADPMGGSQPLDDTVRAVMVEGLRETPGAKVWLAHDGHEFLGACVLFAAYSTFAAKARWNVHDLAVLPQARDRGIGRALLQAVIDEAAGRDVSSVTLEVRKDNERARHLYSSLGFGPGFAEMEFWERPLNVVHGAAERG